MRTNLRRTQRQTFSKTPVTACCSPMCTNLQDSDPMPHPATPHPSAASSPSPGDTADSQPVWFALRDLKRPNARTMAWQQLTDLGFTVFTPLKWVTTTVGSTRQRRQTPVVPDLLFVRTTRTLLDPIINTTPTLQYRFARGVQATPITIPSPQMDTFISAAASAPDTKYYLPSELTPAMIGRSVRIIGGPLEGRTGTLLALRGTRTRRLLISLPGLLTAAVTVAPQFIQLT